MAIYRDTLSAIFVAMAGACCFPAQIVAAAEVNESAPAQNGDIIVTATKRETSLQKTPIAINVVDGEALRDRHIQSLLDLGDGAVPSLRISTYDARQTALTIGIRGIVPLDANQPAREQGVGVYIDGVYLGRQHGLNAALFDVERIEVLKGPQGTLFGRNTEGGALSIVTKRPSGVFGFRGTAGIANFGGYNADAHLDLPEWHGLSVKLDGVIQHQDATVKNPLAGQTGWNYFDRQGLRAAVRWKPSPEFTADFAYDYGHDQNSPFYGQLLNTNPNKCVAGPASAQPACVLPGTAPINFTGTVKPLNPLVQVVGDRRMKAADIGVPQPPSLDKTHGYKSRKRRPARRPGHSLNRWFIGTAVCERHSWALPIRLPAGLSLSVSFLAAMKLPVGQARALGR